jgi:hypothetical protein
MVKVELKAKETEGMFYYDKISLQQEVMTILN